MKTTRRTMLVLLGGAGWVAACSSSGGGGGGGGATGGAPGSGGGRDDDPNGGGGRTGGTAGQGGAGGPDGNGTAGAAGAGTGDENLSEEERDQLVLGEYIPGPNTTGLLPGWTAGDLEPVYPSAGQNHINITTPGPHENKIFWGEVRIQAPAVFRNCMFPGQDPATYSGHSGIIRCFGSGVPQWEAHDCVIDPGLWRDPTVTRPGDAPITDLTTWRLGLSWTTGVYGGSCTLRRCEITNVQDGFGLIQAKADPDDPSFSLIEGCWIHRILFYRGEGWHQEEGTHSDAVQTHVGSNLTLRGNMLGGVRDEAGYEANPGYNSGDDAKNAILMLKQEVSNDELDRIENVLIEKNFFQGGVYCINHSFSESRPNLFETTQIRDNYFVRRGNGRYVIRHTDFADCYSNNRIIDLTDDRRFVVGEPIGYQNG